MSTGPKNPLEAGREGAARGLLWLAHAALGRWVAMVGFPLLALGAAFLVAAWQLGPQAATQARALSKMTESSEARSVAPFWHLDADMRRVREGGHWSLHADMRLCVEAEYIAMSMPHRRVFCALPQQVRAPDRYQVVNQSVIAEGINAVWPLDTRGNPEVALRIGSALHQWLVEQPAAFWMLTPQTESVRERFPPAGTELDYLLLEFDRPIEWLMQGWPKQPETAFEVRYANENPASGYPAILVDNLSFDASRLVFPAFLTLIGFVPWGLGVVLLLYDQPPATRLTLGIIPLLLLPWWSGPLSTALRMSDAQAFFLGQDFMRELVMGREAPLTAHDPSVFVNDKLLTWPALGDSSHYADLLAPLRLTRPAPPPADPDAALRAAVEQAHAVLQALPDADARNLMQALTEAELVDRGEVGLLFLAGARSIALDPERSEPVRRAAADFLGWLTITPLMPNRNDPAFDTRIELWQNLADFPIAPGTAQGARTLLERALSD